MAAKDNQIVVTTKWDDKAMKLKLHSSLAHVTYKLDSLAIKSWFYFISAAFPHIQKEAAVYKIDIGPYKNFVKTTNTEHLASVFEKLKKTEVRLNIFDKETGSEVPYSTMLIAGSGHKERAIYFEIPVSLREVILRHQEMFVLLNLAIVREFSSRYSIALYVSLSDYAIGNKETSKILSLEELRLLFGLESNTFSEYKAFHRNVIKQAVKEINKKGDMTVSYKQIRKGRKVEKIKFSFQVNRDPKSLKDNGLLSSVAYDVKELISKKITKQLDEIGFVFHNKATESLQNLLSEPFYFTAKDIDNYLLYLLDEVNKQVKKNQEEGKAGNPGGLLARMLLDQSRIPAFQATIEKQREAEKQAKAKEQEKIKAQMTEIEQEAKEMYYAETGKQFRTYIISNYDKCRTKLEEISSKNLAVKAYLSRKNISIEAAVLSSEWGKSFSSSMISHYGDFDFNPPEFELEETLAQPGNEELKERYSELTTMLVA